MKETYFNIYPFLYEQDKYLREFEERHYVMNWVSQLNFYQYIHATYFHKYNHSKDLLRILYTLIKDHKRTCKTSTYMKLL